MVLLQRILTDILTALYRSFWPATALTFFMSFFHLYCSDPVGAGRGYKAVLSGWLQRIEHDGHFRKVILFDFFAVMILFQTVLGRNLNTDPLTHALGSWRLWKTAADGTVTLSTDCVENVIMMVPFTYLLLWTYGDQLNLPKRPAEVVWWATKMAFIFSFTIELMQLVMHLGSWQLSDMAYNTLGGALGGAVYCLMVRPSKEPHSDERHFDPAYYPPS